MMQNQLTIHSLAIPFSSLCIHFVFIESSAPKINPFHFPSELATGMRASVLCTVMAGEPPFEFAWFKDGEKLENERKFSIKKFDDFTLNLVISSVDADSNGNFTCRVSNSFGYDQKSAVLSIKGMYNFRNIAAISDFTLSNNGVLCL